MVGIFYTQKALFVTKLNVRQNNVNRSNALCKMIHWGKIPIYCVKSPIQCKITCCGQNYRLSVWLHHENHTLSCTFCVIYTTFVKYMNHFTPERNNLHRHRLWCLWQIWGMPVLCKIIFNQYLRNFISSHESDRNGTFKNFAQLLGVCLWGMGSRINHTWNQDYESQSSAL